ncbi:DUF2235 domain-containing protein [Marinibacterium sp. SX1]|uniref:DUF2235 domain-containing protein n=1 Tax=Marinibacterium sp. SX1 TaxID=3388424 RepID=UPI003D17315E
MARLAVFCDGTWNDMAIPEATHVCELFGATGTPHDAPGNPDMRTGPGQVSVYFPGVGTEGDFATVIGQTINKYGGGAFGWGLNQRIKEAYAWLARQYTPGDEIFIFGFSRGAYTARSLAGMIRKAGFPPDVTRGSVNRAFRLYKQPGRNNGPDKRHIQEARRRLSPGFATSADDLAWRRSLGDDGAALVRIAYLGIWDTVGALGIPQRIAGSLDKIINFRHEFHDTELSSLIGSARHAVSVDERRAFYPPALWDNLGTLSSKVGQGADDIRPDRRYQQMWFAGDHGTIGGSGIDGELRKVSAVTLQWVLDGAVNAGLWLDPAVQVPDVAPDPTAATDILSNTELDKTPARFLEWRTQLDKPYALSPSVDARIAAHANYRPLSLRKVRPGLF